MGVHSLYCIKLTRADTASWKAIILSQFEGELLLHPMVRGSVLQCACLHLSLQLFEVPKQGASLGFHKSSALSTHYTRHLQHGLLIKGIHVSTNRHTSHESPPQAAAQACGCSLKPLIKHAAQEST